MGQKPVTMSDNDLEKPTVVIPTKSHRLEFSHHQLQRTLVLRAAHVLDNLPY